ncbi:MAG TPA: carboxylesterase family protein [Pseudonocardiaceae bacterium]|jgi:para-nitrobenzyl esterase|nr:carboxylesterase family protein [Pseudonocardiaceae bacterium]
MSEVRTTAGTVRGRFAEGLTVFLGIPFAEPPVGDLRFAAPHPARAWDGVRDAVAFGPPPPQENGIPGRTGDVDRSAGDDWLTVNVWTPDPGRAAGRPVMVWIYGGAYKLGSADGYDARHIARDGDVVVVTFNHRVGVEGYAEIEGAPANRGLLDQVAALEWVRDNIAGFGGNPDDVTVFGQSAGAGAIAALLAMPSARGLFHRAIAQSVPGTFFGADLAADIATAIAAEIGLRPTVADLARVPPRELPDAGMAIFPKMRQYEDRWGPVAHTLTPFSPVVDGTVLPTAPWQALAEGAGRDVDLVAGHNRDEDRLFMAFAGQLGSITDDQVTEALRVFSPDPDAYRAAFPDASAEHLYEMVRSDWLFRMPTLHLAQAHVAGGGRAHVYELTFPAPAGVFGACHGLEGPLLFGTFDTQLGPLLIGPEPTPDTLTLSAYIRRAWTAFATTGDPGWPAYDPEQRLVRVLDTEPVVTAYPEETSRRLWQDHTFTALPLRTI